MKITSIKTANFSKDFCIVTVDNGKSEYIFRVIDIGQLPFHPGEVINPKNHILLKISSAVSVLKPDIFRYLSFRMRTKGEVRNYISTRITRNIYTKRDDYSKEELAEIQNIIITSLSENHYLDDKKFINLYTQNNNSRKYPYGMIKIRNDLRQKGISDEDIDAGLKDEVNMDTEYNHAIKLLEKIINIKNIKINEINYEGKQKLIKYLLQKGFSYEISKRAVDSIIP